MDFVLQIVLYLILFFFIIVLYIKAIIDFYSDTGIDKKNNVEIEKIEVDNKILENRLYSLEVEDGDNKTNINTLEFDNTSNKTRISALESDNTSNKNKINSLETDNTSNKNRITTLESDNSSNKNKINTLELDNTSNKTRITALESHDVSNENKINTLDSDNTSNKNKINALETDNTSNKSRITTLETDNTSNKNNITSNKISINTLEATTEKISTNLEKILPNNKFKSILINDYSESKGKKIFSNFEDLENFLLTQDEVGLKKYENIYVGNVFVDKTFLAKEFKIDSTKTDLNCYDISKGKYGVLKRAVDEYYIIDIIITEILGFTNKQQDVKYSSDKEQIFFRIHYQHDNNLDLRFSLCYIIFKNLYIIKESFYADLKRNLDDQYKTYIMEDILFFVFFNYTTVSEITNFANLLIPNTEAFSIYPSSGRNFENKFSFYFGMAPLINDYYINVRKNINVYRYKVYEIKYNYVI